MMLTYLEFFLHALLVFEASVLTMFSSLLMLDKSDMLRFLMMDETSLINIASSSLFFGIENLDKLMFSLAIEMETVRGVWSEVSHQLGWIE